MYVYIYNYIYMIWACWSQLPRVALDNWPFIQRTNAMEICIFGRPLEETKNVDWHCAGLVFFKNFKDGFPQFPRIKKYQEGMESTRSWLETRDISHATRKLPPGWKADVPSLSASGGYSHSWLFAAKRLTTSYFTSASPIWQIYGPIWSKIIKVNPWVLKTPIGWVTIGKFKAPKSSKICLCCSYATCGTQKSGWCCSASFAWVGPLCCSFTMCQSRQSTNDHKFHAAIQHSF